jgi:hypothetical protein
MEWSKWGSFWEGEGEEEGRGTFLQEERMKIMKLRVLFITYTCC